MSNFLKKVCLIFAVFVLSVFIFEEIFKVYGIGVLIYALSLTILVIFVYQDIRGRGSKAYWTKFWEESNEEDEIKEDEDKNENENENRF